MKGRLAKKNAKKKKKKSIGPSASEPVLRAPPPMPAEVRARAEAARMGDTQPMPFMSPYENTAKPTPMERAPNADTVPAFASVQAGGVVTF